MAKTVATTEETTTETVVTKPTVAAKTYEDGVADGSKATLDRVLAYMDGVIETNRGVGYIHVLEYIREAIKLYN